MKQHHSDSYGFSIVELMAAIFLMGALALITTPPLIEIVRSSRLNGATRQIAGDVRQARAQAVGTGWQFRLAGVSAGSSHVRRNHYRLMSRASSAVTWPTVGDPPSTSATLVVGEWVDLGREFYGIQLNPDDSGQFALAFDTRGSPIEMSLSFSPLQVESDLGVKSVSVSTLGSVRVD